MAKKNERWQQQRRAQQQRTNSALDAERNTRGAESTSTVATAEDQPVNETDQQTRPGAVAPQDQPNATNNADVANELEQANAQAAANVGGVFQSGGQRLTTQATGLDAQPGVNDDENEDNRVAGWSNLNNPRAYDTGMASEDQFKHANVNQPRHGWDYTHLDGVTARPGEVSPTTPENQTPIEVRPGDHPPSLNQHRLVRDYIHEDDNQQLDTRPGVFAHPGAVFEGHPDAPPPEALASQRATFEWAYGRLENAIYDNPVMAVRQYAIDLSWNGNISGDYRGNVIRNRADNGATIGELLAMAQGFINDTPHPQEEQRQKEAQALPAVNWHPVPPGTRHALPHEQPVQNYVGELPAAYLPIEETEGSDVHRQTAEEYGYVYKSGEDLQNEDPNAPQPGEEKGVHPPIRQADGTAATTDKAGNVSSVTDTANAPLSETGDAQAEAEQRKADGDAAYEQYRDQNNADENKSV
jgi:hypothetical protein